MERKGVGKQSSCMVQKIKMPKQNEWGFHWKGCGHNSLINLPDEFSELTFSSVIEVEEKFGGVMEIA